mgnify:CR=1 FL=1
MNTAPQEIAIRMIQDDLVKQEEFFKSIGDGIKAQRIIIIRGERRGIVAQGLVEGIGSLTVLLLRIMALGHAPIAYEHLQVVGPEHLQGLLEARLGRRGLARAPAGLRRPGHPAHHRHSRS